MCRPAPPLATGLFFCYKAPSHRQGHPQKNLLGVQEEAKCAAKLGMSSHVLSDIKVPHTSQGASPEVTLKITQGWARGLVVWVRGPVDNKTAMSPL